MTTVVAAKRERSFGRDLLNFLVNRSSPSLRIWSVFTFAVVAALAALVIYNGPTVLTAPWDTFILLDSGWRILGGQIPHTDFHNAIGPLTYELVALGMRITGPSVASIVVADVTVLLGAATWAWLITRQRMTGLSSFLFTVFVALLVAATRPLGFDPRITTYALIYNRYGWTFYCLLLVQLFVVGHSEKRAMLFMDGVSAGVLLGLLFFDKINFFAVGLLAIGLQIILRRSSLKSAGAQLVGFLAVCGVMSLVLRINILNYLQDILAAGRAQLLIMRLHNLSGSLKNNWLNILVFGVTLLLLNVAVSKTENDVPARSWFYTTLIIVGFCWSSAFIITSGNTPEASDLPAVFVSGLILLEAVSQAFVWSSPGRLKAIEIWYLAAFLLMVVVVAGPVVLNDARGLLNTTEWRGYRVLGDSGGQRLESTTLTDYVMLPASPDYPTVYQNFPIQVNDGLRLLRQHVTQTSRIFAVTQSNPFAVTLGLPAPKGSLAWWDLNVSFSSNSYPSAVNTFQDVDLVMIPVLGPQDDSQFTVQGMLAIFGTYLHDHFVQVGQTRYWTLLAKRQ